MPDSLITVPARFAAFAFAICSLRVADDLDGDAVGISAGSSVCGTARLEVAVRADAEETGLADVVIVFGGGFKPGLVSREVVVVAFDADEGGNFDAEDNGRIAGRLVAGVGTGGFPPRTDALNEGVVVAPSEGLGIEELTARRAGVAFE